jgi:HK97 gp10 family phage protein
MARFDTSGIDDIINDMKAMGELVGPTADRMLMAGAEADKQAWKAAARMHGHIDTGDMINSIGYPRTPKTVGGIREIDIYPQGKNRRGERTAAVAFILHYGTSKIKASHWVDDADAIAADTVTTAMRAEYDKILKEKGMI